MYQTICLNKLEKFLLNVHSGLSSLKFRCGYSVRQEKRICRHQHIHSDIFGSDLKWIDASTGQNGSISSLKLWKLHPCHFFQYISFLFHPEQIIFRWKNMLVLGCEYFRIVRVPLKVLLQSVAVCRNCTTENFRKLLYLICVGLQFELAVWKFMKLLHSKLEVVQV